MESSNQKRPKYGGRAKGVPNKVTTELRNILTDIIDDNRQTFLEKLKELNPRDFAIIYIQLCKLVLPTQINLDTPNEKSAIQLTIERLNAIKK